MMLFAALIVAQQQPPAGSVDPTGGLLSYGVLGIVVAALVFGTLVPGYLYKRTEAENERLRKLIDDKVYPTIENATAANREAVELMRTLRLELQQQQTQYRPRE